MHGPSSETFNHRKWSNVLIKITTFSFTKMKSKVKFETSIIRALKDQSKVHVVKDLCPDFEKDYCAYSAKRLSILSTASQLEHPNLKRTIVLFSETVLEVKSCSTAGAPDFLKRTKIPFRETVHKSAASRLEHSKRKGPMCFSVKRITKLSAASQLEQMLLLCWSNFKCCC